MLHSFHNARLLTPSCMHLFYFICDTIITKNIGKEEKKKWRGDLTDTIGAETIGAFIGA